VAAAQDQTVHDPNALYRTLASFTVTHLEHLAVEEGEALPLLRERCSDEELNRGRPSAPSSNSRYALGRTALQTLASLIDRVWSPDDACQSSFSCVPAMIRRGRISLSSLIWIVVGLIVASTHHFFKTLNTASTICSAILAVIVWPLVLLHVHVRIAI